MRVDSLTIELFAVLLGVQAHPLVEGRPDVAPPSFIGNTPSFSMSEHSLETVTPFITQP